jgi:hypothetical protein
MGGRAAETYAKIAAGLRAGDLSVVERLARSS